MTNTIYYAKYAVARNKFAATILLLVSWLAFIVGYLFIFSNDGGFILKAPMWLQTVDFWLSAVALYLESRIVFSGLKMKV